MSRIPLYTQTSYDWHCNKNQNPKPYAVDLNVGTNEYIFGRVTPDNNFIVSTGLINNPKPFGIQMVGGKKSKSKSKSKSNSKSKKGGSNLYELSNFKNNELIYNALDKINKLNGLGANTKNSMINAQNNIVGGKKSKSSLKSNSKSKKGGSEGQPLYNNMQLPFSTIDGPKGLRSFLKDKKYKKFNITDKQIEHIFELKIKKCDLEALMEINENFKNPLYNSHIRLKNTESKNYIFFGTLENKLDINNKNTNRVFMKEDGWFVVDRENPFNCTILKNKDREYIFNKIILKSDKLEDLGFKFKQKDMFNFSWGGKSTTKKPSIHLATKKASMKTTIKLNTKKPVKKSTTKKPSIQSATKKLSIKTTIKLNTKEPVKKSTTKKPVIQTIKTTTKKQVKNTTKKPMKK
jgi:hypothetical protein